MLNSEKELSKNSIKITLLLLFLKSKFLVKIKFYYNVLLSINR